ncbi:MAG: valine--tRNA ligase [Patescibacteria group bacterium]
MEKNFDHAQQEAAMYDLWEKAEAFNPDRMQTKKKTESGRVKSKQFSIIMPPPNANDPLHVGHAMFISVEDILIRYHRMKGDDTVWIPGTDHAGIETQFVFEKKLAKQGKSRFNFDRDTLYKMIWDYVQENSGVAVDQMKKLGASADWSRFKFTLDPSVVDFVVQTFQKMHDDGLVYRDLKLVNYCTHCGTSYSELEVNHTEQTTNLYYIKYPMADDPNEHIVVATTRPEPIFADQYLAVHPDDSSKQHLIGKKVLNPLTKQPMEIIADSFVDPEFGTGIVKLTPAHDFTDFEVAQRHHLPLVPAIGLDGKILENGGEFAGLKVAEARKKVVEVLEKANLIEKINSQYVNRIGTCYRCGRIIEILPLPQFFIKVKDQKNNLTQKVLDVLDKQETKIYGAGREKILRNWLENLKDWNISRQIVWGIRIPVWYEITGNEEKISVTFINSKGEFQKTATLQKRLDEGYSIDEIKKGLQQVYAPAENHFVVSEKNPGETYLPETDTFDTWFSSGQWPIVTLKTNKENDFDRFYPTTVMETAYDILLFWVMRMMMMGVYLENKTPFAHVYLHGLVRDEKGQKMSKSKGNVINPLEFVNKYGADAVRMALIMSSTPGSDSAVGESKIRGMRNFSNKIWNAVRFILLTLEDESQNHSEKNLDSVKDQAFEKKLNEVVGQVTDQLEKLKVGMAAEIAYNEFWHWFCDECIEEQKKGNLSRDALLKGLITFLRLLHPFAPFVTETVWQELWNNGDEQLKKQLGSKLLIVAEWPTE